MAVNPTNPPMGRAPLAAQKAPKFRHSFWWYLKWAFYTLALLVFCVFVAVLSIGYGLYNQLEKVVPDTRVMTMRSKSDSTKIFATDGKTLLAEIKGEDRVWKPFEELVKDRNTWPKLQTPADKMYNLRNVLKATLSIEDARFYIHPGMDTKRLAGALVANLKSGSMGQGGSTITEQLAVNLYQSRNKSVARRLQAALLALQIERRFSKDEILELYVNEIYYGNGAYGCEAAARTYFDKNSDELSIGEAALLAGLPQRPTYYDPFDHFERTKKRQRIVLGEMLENNYITRDQYQAAVNDDSVQRTVERAELRRRREKRSPDRWKAPYFVAYVKAYLAKQWDISEDTLKKGGLKIVTTLQPTLQKEAEDALVGQIRRLSPRSGELQGALVSIDPWTGHVVALVGGRDYYDEAHRGQFNRATQARRQPGSTMKPYIYAAAMEMGYSPNSVVIDSVLHVDGTHEVRGSERGSHEIKNYDFKHRGSLSFKEAMGMSNNVGATRVMLKVGIPAVIQKAHLMGVQSPLRPWATLALGTSEVTPLEHVSAYGVFATRGLRAEPCPVERVENSMGEVLVDHPHPVRGARVMSAAAGDKMWDMLRYVVTSGTGKVANFSRDAIGKTGTTSSNKDVWFMGATKQLVTGVWLGYDKPRELRGSSGGRWCAPVWRSYMSKATDFWNKRNVVEKLVEDSRLTEARRLGAKQDMKLIRVRLCNETGLVATKACPSTHVEVYSAASGVPEQACYVHVPSSRPVRTLGNGDSNNEAPQRGDLGFDPSQSSNGQPAGTSAEPRADDGRWLDQPSADGTNNTGGDVIIHSDGSASRGLSSGDGVSPRPEGESSAPRRERARPAPEATAPPAGGDGY